MNFGSIKINVRVVVVAVAFFFINLVIVTNYYYSHHSITKESLIDQTSNNDFNESLLLEEHFKSNLDKSSYYEKYTIKYLPNYNIENLNSKDSTLIISLISKDSPFGKDRSFEEYFNQVLVNFDNDYGKISLGLLCLTETQFDELRLFLKNYLNNESNTKKFNKVNIIYAPFLNQLNNDRNDRQKPSFQKKRRSLIAKSRNFLINNIIEFENCILSIDSDIFEIPVNSLSLFINSKKDIIVPRIQRGDQLDYDLNSWKGERKALNDEAKTKMIKSQEKAVKNVNKDEEFIFVPMDEEGKMEHLIDISKLLKSNKKVKINELVQIDSVGGAVLFFKSEIWKLGVQFPPFYVIGTDWNLPLGGYDGIETEGFCYEANTIGYTCWAMPNLVAQHSEA